MAAAATVESNPESPRGIITAYINDLLDLPSAVSALAEPIEETYTSADFGQAPGEAQRSAEDAKASTETSSTKAEDDRDRREIERTGMPEPPKAKRTTEEQLYDLWYQVLHIAEHMPWRSEGERRQRLVELVKGLKARPDPPLPAHATSRLRENWVWRLGRLWSELTMLGPGSRASFDQHYPHPAVQGPYNGNLELFLNLNAFYALMGPVEDYFWTYGLWAADEMLEGRRKGSAQSVPEDVDWQLEAFEVWLEYAGEEMWKLMEKGGGGEEAEAALDPSDTDNLPWKRAVLSAETEGSFSLQRWRFWKARMLFWSEHEKLSGWRKQLAKANAARMDEIEAAHPLSK